MGFLDSVFGICSYIFDFGRNVLKLGESVVETISSKISDFVKDVSENIEKAIETIVDTVGEVANKIVELGSDVVDGVGKVLDIGGLVVETLGSSLIETGKFLVDQIREHPTECISIMASLISAGVCFASGNIFQGIVYLSSCFMKSVKLMNELPDGKGEQYIRNMPREFQELYEKHDLKNRKYEELDQYAFELSKKCIPELTDQGNI